MPLPLKIFKIVDDEIQVLVTEFSMADPAYHFLIPLKSCNWKLFEPDRLKYF